MVDHETKGVGVANDFSAGPNNVGHVALSMRFGKVLKVLWVSRVLLVDIRIYRLTAKDVLAELRGDSKGRACRLNDVGAVDESDERLFDPGTGKRGDAATL